MKVILTILMFCYVLVGFAQNTYLDLFAGVDVSYRYLRVVPKPVDPFIIQISDTTKMLLDRIESPAFPSSFGIGVSKIHKHHFYRTGFYYSDKAYRYHGVVGIIYTYPGVKQIQTFNRYFIQHRISFVFPVEYGHIFTTQKSNRKWFAIGGINVALVKTYLSSSRAVFANNVIDYYQNGFPLHLAWGASAAVGNIWEKKTGNQIRAELGGSVNKGLRWGYNLQEYYYNISLRFCLSLQHQHVFGSQVAL